MSLAFSRTPVALALLGLASAVSAPVQAAEFKAGDVDLTLAGIVNAYYTTTSCSGDQTITGAALAGKALGCSGKDGTTTIGNGLLPNALTVGAKMKQDGLDIGATIMIGSAVASNSAIGANSAVDVRQGFLTFGNAGMGTVKIGRDYGMFGANAILGDMTLIGAGAPVNATQSNRVTLGHIGAGYSYLGTYGQLAYTAPAMGGVTLSGALVSPVDADATHVSDKSPQVQVQVSLALPAGKAWVSAKTQKFNGTGAAADFTMSGVEVGGSYSLGAFSVLANLQSGKGLGVLADGDNGDQKQTATLVQATFQATPKVKLGVNYGITRLKDTAGPALKDNSNVTGGLYYGLTKSVTLVGETSQTKSKAANGASAKMTGLALGAILFF